MEPSDDRKNNKIWNLQIREKIMRYGTFRLEKDKKKRNVQIREKIIRY